MKREVTLNITEAKKNNPYWNIYLYESLTRDPITSVYYKTFKIGHCKQTGVAKRYGDREGKSILALGHEDPDFVKSQGKKDLDVLIKNVFENSLILIPLRENKKLEILLGRHSDEIFYLNTEKYPDLDSQDVIDLFVNYFKNPQERMTRSIWTDKNSYNKHLNFFLTHKTFYEDFIPFENIDVNTDATGLLALGYEPILINTIWEDLNRLYSKRTISKMFSDVYDSFNKEPVSTECKLRVIDYTKIEKDFIPKDIDDNTVVVFAYPKNRNYVKELEKKLGKKVYTIEYYKFYEISEEEKKYFKIATENNFKETIINIMKNFPNGTKLLIIMNPPYTGSISNKLIPEAVELADEVSLLYLDTLTDCKDAGKKIIVQATEKYLLNIVKQGKFSDWGNCKVDFPVSIYHFKKNAKDYHTYLDFAEAFRPKIEKQIRAKIAPLPKFPIEWSTNAVRMCAKELNKVNVKDVTKDEFRNYVAKKLTEGEIFINFNNHNKGFCNGMIVKKACRGVTIYNGPKELVKNFENPIYRWLEVMFCANGKDFSASTLIQLPITLPEFTEEELAYLKQFD